MSNKKQNLNKNFSKEKLSSEKSMLASPLKSRRGFLSTVGHTSVAVAGIVFAGGILEEPVFGCGGCGAPPCGNCATGFQCGGSNDCTGGSFGCQSGNTCYGGKFICAIKNTCSGSFECYAQNTCIGSNECTNGNDCDALHTCGVNNCHDDNNCVALYNP